MKSVVEITEQCMNAIERTIKNELPTVSCPEKQQRVMWRRDEVRQAIISRLQTPSAVMIGPKELK